MPILRKQLSHLLLLSIMLYSGQAFAVEPVADVRAVIDVSGSMKKNDPANLRSPALKLLVELMPEGAKSGVWTFGQYVNMNVKQGKVDANWKKIARAEAGKIHSRGLYTNIEDALRKASFGWNQPDAAEKRTLILLTDGVVDVSKDNQLNAASRQRITEELLPQLKNAGVKVHTVALSSEADHELLKQVSALTGGWYERVDNAAQLQKVFLRLFEKSAPVDTLPIKENTFSVDKHVKDMTLVLFHSKKDQSAKIISPDNKTISRSSHGSDVRWHQEQGYELVTIKKPQAGDWQLQTEQDPDNRVMVVTNLRLKVSTLPNSLMTGDELIINAHLTEDGKTISRQDFLNLVDFKLIQDQKGSEMLTESLHDSGELPDELKQDGIYSGLLSKSLTEGQHMLSIKINGPTFKREFRHLLQVYDSPASLEIKKDSNDQFQLVLMPHSDILQLSTVSAQVKLPDGKLETFTHEKTNQWIVIVPAEYRDKTVDITLIGTRMNDKPLKLEFQRLLSTSGESQVISLTEQAKQPVKEQVADVIKEEVKPEEKIAEASIEKQEEKPVAKTTEEVKEQSPEGEGFSWIFVLSMTLVINLLALVAGFFGYKYWKKRSSSTDAEEESEMVL